MVERFLTLYKFRLPPDSIGSYEITLENDDLLENYMYNGTFVGNTTSEIVTIPAPVVRMQLSRQMQEFVFSKAAMAPQLAPSTLAPHRMWTALALRIHRR